MNWHAFILTMATFSGIAWLGAAVDAPSTPWLVWCLFATFAVLTGLAVGLEQ